MCTQSTTIMGPSLKKMRKMFIRWFQVAKLGFID